MSCNFVSQRIPVIKDTTITIKLTFKINVCLNYTSGVAEFNLVVNSGDFDIDSGEILDTNGTGAFYVLADTNKLFTVMD